MQHHHQAKPKADGVRPAGQHIEAQHSQDSLCTRAISRFLSELIEKMNCQARLFLDACPCASFTWDTAILDLLNIPQNGAMGNCEICCEHRQGCITVRFLR